MKRKLLYVKWIDAAGPNETGWKFDSDVQEFFDPPYVIQEVGFLFAENKDYICLVGGYYYNEDEDWDGCCHRVLKIPKGTIIKKIDLTRHIK